MPYIQNKTIKRVPFKDGQWIAYTQGEIHDTFMVYRFSISLNTHETFYKLTLQNLNDTSHVTFVFDVALHNDGLKITPLNEHAKQMYFVKTEKEMKAFHELVLNITKENT